jgi:hypothetical protein
VRVGLFGVDVCELAVQDKVGTERAERGGNLASEERVSEHRAILSNGSRTSRQSAPSSNPLRHAPRPGGLAWGLRTFALQSSKKPIGSIP